MKHIIPFIIGLLVVSTTIFGKTIHYGHAMETITLPSGQSSLLRFDKEVRTVSQAAKFVVQPADSKSPDFRLLSIKPRSSRASGEITIIMIDDTIIRLRLKTSRSGNAEGFYDFKARSESLQQPHHPGSTVSEMELMKAMIRQDKVMGYKDVPRSKKFDSGIEGIKLRLVRSYSGPKFHGYVYQVVNGTRKPFRIDLEQITFGSPNLALLSQVGDPRLKPGSSTLLRIVSSANAGMKNLRLPHAKL